MEPEAHLGALVLLKMVGLGLQEQVGSVVGRLVQATSGVLSALHSEIAMSDRPVQVHLESPNRQHLIPTKAALLVADSSERPLVRLLVPIIEGGFSANLSTTTVKGIR